jgi:hypothetical protein
MNGIPLYKQIASAVDARSRCILRGSTEWEQRWDARIKKMEEALPSGSGFDNGTTITVGHPGTSVGDRSIPDRLVLVTSFHHMDEGGGYDGWTEHQVRVTASLIFDFELRVTGPNRNDIKDHIAETFQAALAEVYPDNHFTEE